MDLSLDEIIKKKKIGVKTVKKGFIARKPLKVQATGKSVSRVVDARNKIIQKNRMKIRDAREKLAQITKASGDARLKLQKKRRQPSPQRLNSNFRPKKMSLPAPKVSLPHLIGVPRGYVDYDKMDTEEVTYPAEYQPAATSLRMTVRNNLMAPFSPYKPSERNMGAPWNNDPFDCYEIPLNRPSDVSEPVSIHRQIRNMSPDILPPKGILRSSRQESPSYSRRFIPGESSQLSYEMRSRLEHAPDPHASMGIFANPLKPQSQSSSSGFRIVVSNLHSSVTQSDIKELFEDIGELNEARLVRPGVAEVIFKTLKDAEKAVDTYHNRQLDGQPMKCLLVNPRASNKPTAPAIKTSNSHSSRSSSKTPLEIDIDALHKVLFRRY